MTCLPYHFGEFAVNGFGGCLALSIRHETGSITKLGREESEMKVYASFFVGSFLKSRLAPSDPTAASAQRRGPCHKLSWNCIHHKFCSFLSNSTTNLADDRSRTRHSHNYPIRRSRAHPPLISSHQEPYSLSLHYHRYGR